MVMVLLSAGEPGQLTDSACALLDHFRQLLRLERQRFRAVGGFSIQLALQRSNPSLPQAISATSKGLQMFFRGDGDLLNRVIPAPDSNRALVTTPSNQAVIKLRAETLLGAFEKFVFGDACSHALNVWDSH